MVTDGSFVNYSSSTINIGYPQPSKGLEDPKKPMSGLVKGIVNEFVRLSPGLEAVFKLLLEFDDDDYSLTITGSPTHVTGVGRPDLGYQITMSIHPRPNPRVVPVTPKNPGRA
jgi:hypothetical protein